MPHETNFIDPDPQPLPTPVPFGQRQAFPQQVRVGDVVGVGDPGLNIRQHVWLQLVACSVADADVELSDAMYFADLSLDKVLARLEELA